MLKDYIRALQTSFTTVTGLRDVLIKIFKGVDTVLEGATKVTEYEVTTTFTKDPDRDTYCKVINGVCYLIINLTGVTATANETNLATIPADLVSKSIIEIAWLGGSGAINIKPDGNIVVISASITNQPVRIVTSFII